MEKLPGDVRYKIQRSKFSHARVVIVDQLKLYEGDHPLESLLVDGPENLPHRVRRASAPQRNDPIHPRDLEDDILIAPVEREQAEPYFGNRHDPQNLRLTKLVKNHLMKLQIL